MKFLKKKLKIIKNEKFLLACFVCLIGSLGNVLQSVFIKYYRNKLNIELYQLITLKCIVSALCLLPFSLKYFLDLKKFKKDIIVVLILALLYSSDILLYNTGLKTVPVNTGTLIMLLVPLWMCFFGKIILHENSFNIVNIVALLSCIGAVVLTVYGDISFNNFGFFNVGVLLIFANSIILPLGVILQKKFSNSRPIIYALFTNAIVLGIVSFMLSNFSIPAVNIERLKGAFLITIFDIMETAGVYISCQMANVALLQPIRFTRIIFAVLVSNFVLLETMTSYQYIGATIILVANFISITYSRYTQRTSKQVQRIEKRNLKKTKKQK